MATPRRQAERLAALLDTRERDARCARRSPKHSRGCRTISAGTSRSASPRWSLGLAISLPLALARDAPAGACAALLLGAASVVQTIPSLALLALFYPLLLGIAALTERAFGAGFSALGFLPSVLALDALLHAAGAAEHHHRPRTASTPPSSEAALGVGMTRRQSLVMVELPLALPVIMAGIRTAAVWVIGAATLSTPIGQTSLGNYIFTGLQTQNWVFVLFGCAAAAVLALLVDQLLALMETGLDAAQAHAGRGRRGSGSRCSRSAALVPDAVAAARHLCRSAPSRSPSNTCSPR